MTDTQLVEFVTESNRIEGITRKPTTAEYQVTELILSDSQITLAGLKDYVSVVAGASLRDRSGMDVCVGNHTPPRGGPDVRDALVGWLRDLNENARHPFHLHQEYETLHPFMDGNGRSGRVLWAWQMSEFGYPLGLTLGFLHCWYYQSLEHGR